MGESYYEDGAVTLYCGDCREVLRALPDASVHCCVTSPPYWGLRDYGVAGQLGLEATPEEYVARLVDVFREVRRVLREDGTLWLNLGDSYCADVRKGRAHMGIGKNDAHNVWFDRAAPGLKPKDLVGIPWRVAFALQADGWWLRSDIIWAKPNPMPESVRDRPTKAHEYVFLLSKGERYHYDAEAVAEPAVLGWNNSRFDTGKTGEHQQGRSQKADTRSRRLAEGTVARTGGAITGGTEASTLGVYGRETRNRRSVWTIASHPYPDAHFATFPPELPEVCIKAGCPVGGTVLDPFAGAGTTGLVAKELNRRAILIELSEAYCALIPPRIGQGVLDFGGVA